MFGVGTRLEGASSVLVRGPSFQTTSSEHVLEHMHYPCVVAVLQGGAARAAAAAAPAGVGAYWPGLDLQQTQQGFNRHPPRYAAHANMPGGYDPLAAAGQLPNGARGSSGGAQPPPVKSSSLQGRGQQTSRASSRRPM